MRLLFIKHPFHCLFMSHSTPHSSCLMWPGLKPAVDWSQHRGQAGVSSQAGPCCHCSGLGALTPLHTLYIVRGLSLWHTLCYSGLKCHPVWAQNNTGDILHCVPVCWGVITDQLIQHPDPVTTSVGASAWSPHSWCSLGVTCHWHPRLIIVSPSW